MPDSLPLIDLEYLAESDDPERCCKECNNFRPSLPAESIEMCDSMSGSCFGIAVSAAGTCRMFVAKSMAG